MRKEENSTQMLMEGVENPDFSHAEKVEEVSSEPVYETETGEQIKFDTDVDLGLDKAYVDEKIKEVMDSQSPQKRRKSTIVSLILLLVNLIFMAFIVKGLISNVGDVDFESIVKTQGSKLWWLAGGVGIYCLYMFSQVLMYQALIKDLTGKSRWKLAYDVAVTGKYYDNVTPFAVGGQPMQILKLAKNKISPGVSTSIPIIKLLVNSTVNVVLVLLFFIFGLPRLPLTSAFNDMLLFLLEILGVIGLIITVIMTLFMILISSGSLMTRSIVSSVIKLGYRLKIVKNYRVTLKKTINQFAEYRNSMKYLWKHKGLLLKMILYSTLECLTYAVMPYFVVQAFMLEPSGMTAVMFLFICIVKYYICAMASSYIPLPGGTGLIEISFIFLFGIVVRENIVWALLAWRFLSYYLIVLHGFVHELSGIVKKLIKNRKLNQSDLK
ncbi:MAG: flippase-like domain-containing protein [Clostridia bacterium]|nr:flippase-like domain-containing protein [Clostridia bacterium]